MTIATEFTDWPRYVKVGAPYSRCAPALVELAAACRARYGVQSLGCYGVRPIRGGEIASTHSYGAAIDLSYGASATQETQDNLIGYLVGNSAEWGLSAIHDYRRSRIWRAGRTGRLEDACSRWWKAQRTNSTGMGQPWAHWVHVEVAMAGWHDARSEAARGIA